MLVDLARNDVGRVSELRQREGDRLHDHRALQPRHAHRHQRRTARSPPDKTAYDVMRATFPAGTVSGSPKVRAMQIINELEKSKRGAYAGAVGYFGFDGNLDSCIALRTVVLQGRQSLRPGRRRHRRRQRAGERIHRDREQSRRRPARRRAGAEPAAGRGPRCLSIRHRAEARAA